VLCLKDGRCNRHHWLQQFSRCVFVFVNNKHVIHPQAYLGGGKGGKCPPNVFSTLEQFILLLTWIMANKNRQKKENEKLAFYVTNFALFQVWLLCKIKFLIPTVYLPPHAPNIISQVTFMNRSIKTCTFEITLLENVRVSLSVYIPHIIFARYTAFSLSSLPLLWRNFNDARCGFLTAMLTKVKVFWDMTPCRLRSNHRHSGGRAAYIFSVYSSSVAARLWRWRQNIRLKRM
jgi:hypothetical protein